MKHIELYIRKKDWFIIIAIGLFISSFLSIFIYYLLDLKLYDGAIFGLLLGGFITLLSMLFISILNTHILPDIAKKYWLMLAVLFSFLSGFCGTSMTLVISVMFNIDMVSKITDVPILFSSMLGILTYFVGALMYAMVKMANIQEENEKKLIQSRLKSLEMQLNPHFLFNSLNSLAELIHENVPKSEKTILTLSSFLRHTMKEKTMIKLEEEISNVKSYIELENIRFEDEIYLQIEPYEEYKNELVPKFSIQLIVENAIKHGFGLDDGMSIDIKVQKQKELNIFISNDGKRIKNKKFGIGLKNLQERLTILCNGKVEVIDLEYPTYLIKVGKCNENIGN